MSKITLNYNGQDYILEYNRQSVKTMESQGFSVDEISAKPMTMIPALFKGAFIKNHPRIHKPIMDEIFDEIQDKSGLIAVLLEMYGDTLSTLMEDKAEGNVSWALNK